MALAVDASSPAKVAVIGTVTPATTASFTAPTNALLVAYIFYNSISGNDNNQTVTDSGGLSWTRNGRKSRDLSSLSGVVGTDGGVEIWSATTSSSVARTVSAAHVSGATNHATLVVKVYTDSGGAPTIGAIAASFSASGLPSASLTTTAANSWVWSVSSDWAQKGAGTAGASQTLSTSDENDVAGQYSGHVWRQTSTTATASSVTNNLTAVSAQQYNMLIVEVKANPATAFPRPVRVSQAVSRAAVR